MTKSYSQQKKTIAFVIVGLSSGGAERVISLLANDFVKQYKVIIITFGKAEPFYPLSSDIKLVHCIDIIKPSTSIFDALKTNFKLYKKIKQYLKQYEVHSAIAFITRANILTTLAGNNLNIPVVISDRNNPWEKDQVLAPIWLKLRKWIYPRAQFVVLQTKKIADFYLDFVPKERIKIIPNPINPDFKFRETEKKNIILNVGRLDAQKNQKQLIEVFAKMKLNDWVLHIVGEGKERKNLEALIKKLNVHNSVKLIGRSDTIEKHYLESKIFAFTSLYEGFPNALLEAMAFGLPCVSTDCPTGPSELITSDENGFLIPMHSDNELEQKLSILVNHEEKRASLGEKAHLSTSKYHIDAITPLWRALA
ncbi:MAG: glycosyltransferase family 4 protein [Maribacter sp.]